MGNTVEGLVLAAGLSSRAGSFKLALDVFGASVIERCVESMRPSCKKIVVVCGYKHHIIERLLKPYSYVETVINEDYEAGMFSSVKTGLKHTKGDRFFLIPGDYPLVQRSTYTRLLEDCSGIVIPRYEGRKGHPVLISSEHIPEILENRNYSSLRDFINAVGYSTVDVDDPGILVDIDTMEDYRSIVGNCSEAAIYPLPYNLHSAVEPHRL